MGGDFNPRQSWSGLISQFNVWNWALEDYFIENAAECRSDLLGNIIKWKEERWYVGKVWGKKYNVVHDLTTINSVWCQNEEYATF